MKIQYDFRVLENVFGSGRRRVYARARMQRSMSRRQLSESISRSCSLKPSDVEAVMTELGEILRIRLAEGHRVYLPEIGYFDLSLGIENPDLRDKVTAQMLRVRNVSFRPEKSLLQELRKSASFERAVPRAKARVYTEQEMVEAVREYMSGHACLTSRLMQSEFGVSYKSALQWLGRLVELGVLVRSGGRRSSVYLAAEP